MGPAISGAPNNFGKGFHYNLHEGVLGGLEGRSLELVARFNYSGLNDIVKVEYYAVGCDQYYPDGYMTDWPYNSSRVGCGNVKSYTIGLNYSFNKYAQVMLNYTYHDLQKDCLPYDRKLHSIQGRVQFTF